MKKTLFITTFIMMCMVTVAQNVTLTNGAYDKVIVERYDSITAPNLYVRALETLSDWAGTQKKSKIGIDVQDKENGLVVFKGQVYIGFHKSNMLAGWNVYADCTIKIRCKDGRAQLSCHVPTMTFDWSVPEYPATETAPLGELIPEYTHKQRLRIKKSAIEFAHTVPQTFDNILVMIAQKMHQEVDDF